MVLLESDFREVNPESETKHIWRMTITEINKWYKHTPTKAELKQLLTLDCACTVELIINDKSSAGRNK